MKKKLALLLTTLLSVATLTACGNKDASETAGDIVTLPDYKTSKVAVTVSPIDVTEEEVDAYIASALQAAAVETEVTDRPVETGDVVNIDYVGTKDGVAFEGGSSAEGGYDLTIGSGRFIEGFEDGLIGANLGENVQLNLTFPEEYGNEELNGAAVVFDVTVNSITTYVTPELTDEVVPTLDENCSTVEEYRQSVSDYLLDSETQTYHNTIANQVYAYILENTTFGTLPEDLVATYKTRSDEMAQSYATAYGVDLETFVTNMFGMTVEEFDAESQAMSEDAAKENLLFRALAEQEGVTVSDDEIKAFAEENYSYSGLASADEYIENIGRSEIEVYLLSEKVMELLEGYAEVTEE